MAGVQLATTEDAISFATIAVLFLWDCYVVVPSVRKLLYFCHDEFGLSKGIELPGSAKVQSTPAGSVRPNVLPVWSTKYRDPHPRDPIGCPVSVTEMVEYAKPQLKFKVVSESFEFIQQGQMDAREGGSHYWLWKFTGERGRRWNLCVFTGQDGANGPKRTWMCADNNPYNLNDHNYVVAIYRKQY